MNAKQLDIAKREWGFAMDLRLENNKIYVANDGYITGIPLKMGKHTGEYEGFYYFSARKGTVNVLRNVISTLSEMQGVTA